MKKCILCNSDVDIKNLWLEEELGEYIFSKGYCSKRCYETDKMVLRADCEDDK